MDRDLDTAMCDLAERQHSVVSRCQARNLGADRWALRRRVASGRWQLATPEVLRLAGVAGSFTQGCMVAVLHAGEGAAVSHLAAAALWGVPGFSEERVEVSRQRGAARHRSLPARLHEPRYLPEHHCTVRYGVPVTSVARTMFDLSARLHPQRTERALENALTRKLVTLKALHAVTIELVEHGRTGSALMRQLLADRGVGYIPPASGLEARFLALLAAAGLDLPACQVDLGGESWIGRVDFYYCHVRLIIEIDSDIHHTAKLDIESDERRDAALRAAGFEVLRIKENELLNQPRLVVAKVRAALGGP